VTTLNPRQLDDALRACARGIHPLEAGTGLLIDCGSWLHRGDFTSRFITTGTCISDGATLLASIDWEAAVTALHAGGLPASGGEGRMLLLAASIAAEPRSASTTPCPASTAATRASWLVLSPMPLDYQIHIKKRTNDI
jgi:hypothetical protein